MRTGRLDQFGSGLRYKLADGGQIFSMHDLVQEAILAIVVGRRIHSENEGAIDLVDLVFIDLTDSKVAVALQDFNYVVVAGNDRSLADNGDWKKPAEK